MRILPVCAALVAATLTVPAICQSNSFTGAAPTTTTASSVPADASNASVNYAALREQLSQQNKVLQDKLNVQRGILKKNQELLKEAQKLDAENKRLEAETQRVAEQNANLEKQREALKSAQKPTETASN